MPIRWTSKTTLYTHIYLNCITVYVEVKIIKENQDNRSTRYSLIRGLLSPWWLKMSNNVGSTWYGSNSTILKYGSPRWSIVPMYWESTTVKLLLDMLYTIVQKSWKKNPHNFFCISKKSKYWHEHILRHSKLGTRIYNLFSWGQYIMSAKLSPSKGLRGRFIHRPLAITTNLATFKFKSIVVTTNIVFKLTASIHRSK